MKSAASPPLGSGSEPESGQAVEVRVQAGGQGEDGGAARVSAIAEAAAKMWDRADRLRTLGRFNDSQRYEDAALRILRSLGQQPVRERDIEREKGRSPGMAM